MNGGAGRPFDLQRNYYIKNVVLFEETLKLLPVQLPEHHESSGWWFLRVGGLQESLKKSIKNRETKTGEIGKLHFSSARRCPESLGAARPPTNREI